MSAYLIINAVVGNEEAYSAYRRAVVPVIKRFSGEIVRNEKARLIEGPSIAQPPTLIRFPSTADLNAFWDSADYNAVKSLRDGAADLIVWAIA